MSLTRWGCAFFFSSIALMLVMDGSASTRVQFLQALKSQELPESGFHCATCDYMQEQYARIRSGKKPLHNNTFVPEGFWSDELASTPSDAHDWPGRYYSIDPDRVDTDGDGLLEMRYSVDFSAFIPDGAYTQAQVDALEAMLDRSIVMYNNALQHVGLEFVEVSDGSQQITMTATTNAQLGGSTGLARLYGAIRGTDSFLYLRSTYTRFGPALPQTDNGAPNAFAQFPPGNPFAVIFPPRTFREVHDGSEVSKFAVSSTILHELGHLLGLRHPFDAYANLGTGDSGYLVDWLAWPTVGNPPPSVPSTVMGGEPFESTQWSRGLYNTFMTYDDGSDRVVYPDLPASIKAFIAHYYGINTQASAQVLLDEALTELRDRSPVARGEMIIEAEPNDSVEQAVPIQAGLPILAALSKTDANNPIQQELFTDTVDWFQFEVADTDVNRPMIAEVSIGSQLYNGFFYSRGAVQYDGDVQIVVRTPDGVEFLSDGEEFPSLDFVPFQAGTYFVAVQQNSRPVFKDYVLSVAYQDGLPGNAPGLPATPTATPFVPDPNATPISQIQEIDGAIVETYIVLPDGDNNILNDPRTENPQPGQTIRFQAHFRNIGLNPLPSQSYEMFVNGVRHASSSTDSPSPVGQTLIWQTRDYTAGAAGIYEYEWRFTVPGDGNVTNNTITVTFPVGNVVVPTSTPTSTPTPTNTPVPTSTPTPPPAVPTNTPVVATPQPSTDPPAIVSFVFGDGDLAQNGMVEIPGTFSALPAAQVSVVPNPQPGGEALDVAGHVLQIDGNAGEGTMVLFSSFGPVPASGKLIVRGSAWANTANVQVFLGLIDTDASGNLTGSGLSLLNLGSSTDIAATWDRLLSIHKPASGFAIPLIQVVSNEDGAVVQFDSLEVFAVEPGASFDFEFFGD